MKNSTAFARTRKTESTATPPKKIKICEDTNLNHVLNELYDNDAFIIESEPQWLTYAMTYESIPKLTKREKSRMLNPLSINVATSSKWLFPDLNMSEYNCVSLCTLGLSFKQIADLRGVSSSAVSNAIDSAKIRMGNCNLGTLRSVFLMRILSI